MQEPCSDSPLRVLLVEDSAADARLVQEQLRDGAEFDVTWVQRLDAARAILAERRFDAVLLDLLLPDARGTDLLAALRPAARGAAIIVLSGQAADDRLVARAAILKGAEDFLPKSGLAPHLLARMLTTAVERSRLAAALRERERQLEEAQALAHLGHWAWRVERPSVELSGEAARLLGWPAPTQRVPLGHLLRRLPRPMRHLLLDCWRVLRAGGARAECRLVLPARPPADGAAVDLVFEARAHRDGRGRIDAVFGILRDVSEQGRLERLKDEIVAVLGHELRTPLTTIRAALGLLPGLLAAPLPGAAARLLESAERNADRLASLVGDLLDLDRLERGAMPCTPARLELVTFLRDAIAGHEAAAGSTGVALRVSGAADLACHADSGKLRRVVDCVLADAISCSPQGGVVDIRARADAARAWIEITDAGPCHAARQDATPFGPVDRRDGSIMRRGSGKGLGFALVERLLALQGGTLERAADAAAGGRLRLGLPLAA